MRYTYASLQQGYKMSYTNKEITNVLDNHLKQNNNRKILHTEIYEDQIYDPKGWQYKEKGNSIEGNTLLNNLLKSDTLLNELSHKGSDNTTTYIFLSKDKSTITSINVSYSRSFKSATYIVDTYISNIATHTNSTHLSAKEYSLLLLTLAISTVCLYYLLAYILTIE